MSQNETNTIIFKMRNKGKENNSSNQSSKFSPNSIGGMLDDLVRDKLLKIKSNHDDKHSEKSIQRKGSEKQP